MNTEVRFLLAIGLMIAVIVVTNIFFPPAKPQGQGGGAGAPAQAVDTTGVAGSGTAAPAPGTAQTNGAAAAAPSEVRPSGQPSGGVPAPAESEPGHPVVVESGLYRLTFSTRGARLVSARLQKFKSFTEEGSVELIPQDASSLGNRLVVGGDTLDLRSAPFQVVGGQDHVRVDSAGGDQQLTFRYTRPGTDFSFSVTYTFHPGTYVVDARGSVTGLSRPLLVTDLGSGLRFNEADSTSEARAMAYVGNHLDNGVKSHALSGVDAPQVEEGPFLWAALKSKFFVMALMPDEGAPDAYLGGLLVAPRPGEHRALVSATQAVGADGTFDYRTFMGPQDLARLTALGNDLEEVNPYGWRFIRPVVRPIVGVITVVLVFLHSNLNLAYGWVLILFGALMRLVLWPLNHKAMKAQLRNMAVQPLVKEIQTKYKDNPERLQKEMMALYKEHGFNPLAGCLPMLLPWPVLISLFFVFQNTIELRGVGFLWLPDLSAPDPLFILPVFMGVSMFLNQFISMRSMPETNSQMKMMMWMMPAFMIFIFFRLAAGLNLYYATANIFTIPQQIMIARERQKAQAAGPVKRTTG